MRRVAFCISWSVLLLARSLASGLANGDGPLLNDTELAELMDNAYVYEESAGDIIDELFDDQVETVEAAFCSMDEQDRFNGTAPCDVEISGVDSQIQNLAGGIDGLYKLESCESSRPLYRRQDPSPRLMWFSKNFFDWEIANQTAVDNVTDDDILLYGGTRRDFSADYAGDWNIQARLLKNVTVLDDYAPISFVRACIKESEPASPAGADEFGKVPLISDKEYAETMQTVYKNAANSSSSPQLTSELSASVAEFNGRISALMQQLWTRLISFAALADRFQFGQ